MTSQTSPPAIDIPPSFFNNSDNTATTTATITKNQGGFYDTATATATAVDQQSHENRNQIDSS